LTSLSTTGPSCTPSRSSRTVTGCASARALMDARTSTVESGAIRPSAKAPGSSVWVLPGIGRSPKRRVTQEPLTCTPSTGRPASSTTVPLIVTAGQTSSGASVRLSAPAAMS